MIINLQNKSNGGGSGQNVFKVQDKTVDITESGLTTIVPDEGYNGLSKVDVNVAESKISVKDTGIKFGSSTFTKVPDMYDFTGITNGEYMFRDCWYVTSFPSLDCSQITEATGMFQFCSAMSDCRLSNTNNIRFMSSLFEGCYSMLSFPTINTSSAEYMDYMFRNCHEATEIHFSGGVKPECSTMYMFSNVKDNGTFYYDLPGNYDPVIRVLPDTWKTQPLGDINIKLRVYLNDAGQNTWATDAEHTISINGQPMTYTGKDALWETTVRLTKENAETTSKDVTMDGTVIGQIEWKLGLQQIDVGQVPKETTEYTGQQVYDAIQASTNDKDMVASGTVDGNGNIIGSNGELNLKYFPPILKKATAVELDIDPSISLDPWGIGARGKWVIFNSKYGDGDSVVVDNGNNIYRAPLYSDYTTEGFECYVSYTGDDSLVRLTKIISETIQYPPYPVA